MFDVSCPGHFSANQPSDDLLFSERQIRHTSAAGLAGLHSWLPWTGKKTRDGVIGTAKGKDIRLIEPGIGDVATATPITHNLRLSILILIHLHMPGLTGCSNPYSTLTASKLGFPSSQTAPIAQIPESPPIPNSCLCSYHSSPPPSKPPCNGPSTQYLLPLQNSKHPRHGHQPKFVFLQMPGHILRGALDFQQRANLPLCPTRDIRTIPTAAQRLPPHQGKWQLPK